MMARKLDIETYFGAAKSTTTPPTLDSIPNVGEALIKMLVDYCNQVQTWHKEQSALQETRAHLFDFPSPKCEIDTIEFTFVGTPYPRKYNEDEKKAEWPAVKKGYGMRIANLYPPVMFTSEIQVKLLQMARALDTDFRKAVKSKKATIYFSWQTTMVHTCLDFAVMVEAYNKE